MYTSFHRLFTFLSIGVAAALLATNLQADPLPTRDLLKFDQEPQTGILPLPGTNLHFFGHDELSTAYADVTNPVISYAGTFMADDFADKFTTPVVHVTWWGSYINDLAANPQPHVQHFLVAFESDVPAVTVNGVVVSPSHPGCTPAPCNPVLASEVVSLGALAPNSGTFTEAPVPRPTGDPLNETLYKYNAELKLPFAQQPDTVYWLKIAALVDLPVGVPVPPPQFPGLTQWGWHNRDYTINDPLASTPPLVSPGEHPDGTIPGTTIPIWHFQDDAVQGDLQFTPSLPIGQQIRQQNMNPTFYVSVNSAGVGLIDGPPGIEQKSKDLAFQLYTTVPEPASCLLLVCSSLGLLLTRRHRA